MVLFWRAPFISTELRINHQIRAREVRVINEKGEQIGVMPVKEAQTLAFELDYDLVEVAPDADPPVCRIMDYGKYKYKLKKKGQQAKKKQHIIHLKTLRIRPKTDEHDLQTKVRFARRFLENGDKVQINLVFKGREMSHKEIGSALLNHFIELLADIAKIERPPNMDGRTMTVVLSRK